MPETLEEFARRTRQELRQELLQEWLLEWVQKLTPEERLAGLSAEDVKKLSPEFRAELLRCLTADEPSKPQ